MLSVLFNACLFISMVITILPGDQKENINKMLIVTFLKLLPEGKRGLSIKHYKLTKGQNNYGTDIQLNIYMTSFSYDLIPFNSKLIYGSLCCLKGNKFHV